MGNAAARRERRKIERREAILDAAAHVFGQKGAHAATMDDVAEAAEVSKGTLYLYFPSRDELVVALAHRPLDAVLERFDAMGDEGLDGLSLLRRLVAMHQQTTQEHAAQLRVAIGSLCTAHVEPSTPAAAPREYGERVRRLRSHYFAAIQRGMADGSIRPDIDPEEVGAALWAGMFGASFIRMNADRYEATMGDDPPPYPLEQIHEAVAKLLFRAIAADREVA
ncbi:MAG: TetR/AcrR family transcriptional regulator [Myxococcales bacterium]|nr:TetR/AcrR family transcriptional regulator [Myxococcales bacterium]